MGKAKVLQVPAVVLLVLASAGNLQARGPGIAAGDGRLHPALKLDLVFDSNPGYFAENPVMDLMLRIRPGLSLAFPSRTVAFELNSSVGYDYYFGVDNSRTSDLSTFAGEADLRLGFNPEGQVSFFWKTTSLAAAILATPHWPANSTVPTTKPRPACR